MAIKNKILPTSPRHVTQTLNCPNPRYSSVLDQFQNHQLTRPQLPHPNYLAQMPYAPGQETSPGPTLPRQPIIPVNSGYDEIQSLTLAIYCKADSVQKLALIR